MAISLGVYPIFRHTRMVRMANESGFFRSAEFLASMARIKQQMSCLQSFCVAHWMGVSENVVNPMVDNLNYPYEMTFYDCGAQFPSFLHKGRRGTKPKYFVRLHTILRYQWCIPPPPAQPEPAKHYSTNTTSTSSPSGPSGIRVGIGISQQQHHCQNHHQHHHGHHYEHHNHPPDHHRSTQTWLHNRSQWAREGQRFMKMTSLGVIRVPRSKTVRHRTFQMHKLHTRYAGYIIHYIYMYIRIIFYIYNGIAHGVLWFGNHS